MNKKKFIIIGVGLLVVISALLLIFNNGNKFNSKLIDYIEKKDYVLDIGTIYKSKDNYLDACNENTEGNCESYSYFFNTDNFDYYMNKNIKKNNVMFEFKPLYNYVTDEIIYHYRSSYNNGILLYFGTYSEDEFTCELDYSYGVNANKDKICEYIKEEVEAFYITAKFFITDSYLLDNMKK